MSTGGVLVRSAVVLPELVDPDDCRARQTAYENHWTDLLRTAISIRENKLSSVTLLRRLDNHPRKNRLYRAFRELGSAIRTITLLRYLAEAGLREQITQVTNATKSSTGSPTG